MCFIISKIYWERIFLHLEISASYDENVKFYFQNIEKKVQKIPIFCEGYLDGKYLLSCNIVAANQRQFLDNGCWEIVAVSQEKEYLCSVSFDEAYHLEECARIYRYGNDKYAYNVSFSTKEVNSELTLILHSHFMIENRNWKKRCYIQEVDGIKKKSKRVMAVIAMKVISVFYRILSFVFRKRGNHILFMSETKGEIGGNLKAIDQGIKERGLEKRFVLDYWFRDTFGKKRSLLDWGKLIVKLAKQDVIFVDDYVPIFGFLTLSKKTKLVQVWHAGEGFKAVGYCRFGKDGTPHPAASCHKKYDYALTCSDSLVKVFEEVFGIEKEAFLSVGMPRLDGFLNEERIIKFRQEFYLKYPNLKDKKMILFAPTYRGTGQKTAYYDYSWLDLKEIYEFCQNDYIFVIKMHPFIDEMINIPSEYKNRIVDFTDYPNINELYYVTDLLITDYSSNYFEYSLMKRPVLFYTPDREIYELTRGVHRGVKETAPGKVCDTFEEMMYALREEDYEIEKLYRFVEANFKNYDENTTEQVIAKILNAN